MTDGALPLPLPPRLRQIVEAEYPRYGAAEMARRRAALEAVLAEAGCDHLVFCGANRVGSAVQWLTQWPVTVEAIGVLTPRERDALFVQWINHAPLARRLAPDPPSAPPSRCWRSAARRRTASASSAR
jgi:Xaa-Pro dipeptidase